MELITKLLITSGSAFLVAACIFFTAGWLGALDNRSKALNMMDSLTEDKLQKYPVNGDIEKIEPENIRMHLQEFTRIPHVAGLDRDEILAKYIRDNWIKYGLDEVTLNPYELLLSYPDQSNPNKIRILFDNEEDIFVSHHREDFGPNVTLDENFVDAFLAYSPPGEVEGDIVYVNYGTIEDYKVLTDENSEYYTNLTGRICMMRFGRIYRGNKVQNAYDNGCYAAIIYSDPVDVAGEGTDPANVYPNKPWLPGTGMQRGSLKLVKGDPETPFWPSLPNVYRLEEEELKAILPQIPAQNIGYDDAKEIFSLMSGKKPPAEWMGSDILDYKIGGEFHCQNCKARVTVNNKNVRKTSSNVIGIIRGDVEPDRYVLLGNHRDAWGYGSVDPNSGTAQMMEVTRILGEKMKNSKWRPRRTLVFLSWGAEEFGLIGSREFNEDFMYKLSERSVAYINVDICMAGPIFRPSSTPTLRESIIAATKLISSPHSDNQTLFEFWDTWSQEGGNPGPVIPLPHAGSDHAFFIFLNGIPVYDLTFRSDSNKYDTFEKNLYAAYHTAFETFDLVDRLLDPGFAIHQSCAELSLIIGRNLSDSLVLDFKIEEYGDLMVEAIESMRESGALDKLASNGIETEYWIEAVHEFKNASVKWRQRFLEKLPIEDPLLARVINDQIMKLDRLFIMPNGLPGRPDIKHAIISPSLFNSYGSSVFPGISDLLHEIESLNETALQQRIKDLKVHITELMAMLKSAKDHLKEVHVIL